MNKKGALSLLGALAIIFIILLLLGAIDLSGILPGTASIFEKITLKETVTEKTTTETINQEVNLCSLFQPYIAPSNVINDCNTLGGDWNCRDDLVGCVDTTIAGIDCSGPVIASAIYQCQSVGAEYVCNPNNAYCIR